MNRSSQVRKKSEWRTVDAGKYHSGVGDYADRVDRETIARFVEGHCGRALDLPCGTGRMTPLLRHGFDTVSADYSPTMLEFASKDPEFVGARIDAFAMGFADASFDLILCLRLSFHYSDFGGILAEFHRILKPGGVLVFDSLNPWTLRRLLAYPLNWVRGDGSRKVHFRSRKELLEILGAQGFEVVRTERRYLLPTRSYRFLPTILWPLLTGLERILPASIRVLTYWKVVKKGSET